MSVLLVSMQLTRVGTSPMPAAPKVRRRHGLLLANSADIPAGDKPPRYSSNPSRTANTCLRSDTAQAVSSGGRRGD